MKTLTFRSLGYALACFMLGSAIFFGGPFRAIMLLSTWRDRLGAPYWEAIVALAIAIAFAVSWIAGRCGFPRVSLPSILVLVSGALSALFVSIYAEQLRDAAIDAFQPDHIETASMFSSYRNAPRDFQFFLHSAALKDCAPYAWSYRTMSFYELPPNVAINVLPHDWVRECSIERS